MKKRICAMMAALMMMPSFCCASAIEKDKAEHFGAGVAVDYAEAALFPKWTPFERFLGVVAIAGAKEIYDHNHSDRHSAEWKDFAATCLGGLTGEGTIWIVHTTW